jgi:glycosyltransferase involved in cell wall biosynthesis
MKLHTVFITYNRLELTKQAIESYLETVTVPWTASIVDNGSTDGTEEWFFDRFNEEPIGFTALGENKYPGFAANLGWGFAFNWADGVDYPTPTHLHRADNDFIFLPGWCDEVERMFDANPRLGQLGMRTDEEEFFNGRNVGGNCVIRRELWDEGLRYDERPWPKIARKVPGYTEDSYMSPKVLRMGWEWDRVERPCIQSISYEDPADPYYQQTWADRGISR